MPSSVTTVRPRFVSLRGFCRMLGVSPGTGIRLLSQGLPTMQPAGPGGRHLIDVQEALAWLKSQDEKHRRGEKLQASPRKKFPASRNRFPRSRKRTPAPPSKKAKKMGC